VRSVVKRVLGVVGVGLAVGLAAGCSSPGGGVGGGGDVGGSGVGAGSGADGGGSAGGTAASLETTNLTVASVPVADDAGLYIAEDEGLFKAAGLNVTIKPITSSEVAAQGMNDGTYDVTAGNAVSFIQDQVSGESNLEIVSEGSLMQEGNQALYTLPSSRITTIDDLKGARIGVNAPNNILTLLITSVLAAHGLPASAVHFVPIATGFPGMAKALQDHQIDAAELSEPFGSMDTATMGLRELADLDQGATTGFPISWYVVTKAWAKRNPGTLDAFLGALRQGQRVADTNRAEVEDAMEKLPQPYTVPAEYAAIMTLESYPVDTAPDIDLSRVQRVADAMYEFGMLSKPFSVSTMLTP
jgi:NitT/TauT family transport system substrate-binding protein